MKVEGTKIKILFNSYFSLSNFVCLINSSSLAACTLLTASLSLSFKDLDCWSDVCLKISSFVCKSKMKEFY